MSYAELLEGPDQAKSAPKRSFLSGSDADSAMSVTSSPATGLLTAGTVLSLIIGIVALGFAAAAFANTQTPPVATPTAPTAPTPVPASPSAPAPAPPANATQSIGFSAFLSADTTLPSDGTPVTLTWTADNSIYGTTAYYNASKFGMDNAGHFIVPETAIYMVSANLRLDVFVAGGPITIQPFCVFVIDNQQNILVDDSIALTTGSAPVVLFSFSRPVYLAAASAVSVSCSISGLQALLGAGLETAFSIERLAQP